jgi:hypothetical protein
MNEPTIFKTVEDITLYISGQRIRHIDKEVNQPTARWVTIIWRYRRHGETTDHAMLTRYEFKAAYNGYVQVGTGIDLGRPELFRWAAGILWGWYKEGPAYEDKAAAKRMAGREFATNGYGGDDA